MIFFNELGELSLIFLKVIRAGVADLGLLILLLLLSKGILRVFRLRNRRIDLILYFGKSSPLDYWVLIETLPGRMVWQGL